MKIAFYLHVILRSVTPIMYLNTYGRAEDVNVPTGGKMQYIILLSVGAVFGAFFMSLAVAGSKTPRAND